MNTVALLRAAVVRAKGNDFIKHKKRAVLGGPLAHGVDKLA